MAVFALFIFFVAVTIFAGLAARKAKSGWIRGLLISLLCLGVLLLICVLLLFFSVAVFDYIKGD